MPHIMDVVGKFCLKRNSQEIFLEAQRRRLPWAPINTAAELLRDPHLIDRGFFVEAESALYGKVTYPGVAFKGMPAVYETEDLDFCPPELGQDARAVLEWLGLSEDQIRSLILAESV
jgi:crotonobetainyl-CoA:carnitine CoA-transferase CaiB-like acyl-CoA transferase